MNFTPVVRHFALFLFIATAPSVGQSYLHDEQKEAAKALEASTNPHLNHNAGELLSSVWLNPHIFVCWENPSPDFQQEMNLVQQEVNETWQHDSQLRFTGWQKCATENKGIHILIDDSPPHTVGLGRALDGTKNGMVLNFTFHNWAVTCQTAKEQCVKTMSGHEFGHAIGLNDIGEAPGAHPACQTPSDDSGTVPPDSFDEQSIMNRCYLSYDKEGKLSALDIDAVRVLYGPPISPSGIAGPKASIQLNQQGLATKLESSKNPHLSEHAYVMSGAVWPQTHLYVCWENPSPEFQHGMMLVQEEVKNTWEKESGLTFTGWQQCAAENKGIHILIDDSPGSNKGPHTGLGRVIDGLHNGMVLNFTFHNWNPGCQTMRDYCIKVIGGHEFGHAIGFAHEQNRPDVPGECQKPPDGDYGTKTLTPYDEHSIMNYCNKKYNNDGNLSALDIDAVRQLYGPPPGIAVAVQ